MSFSFNPRLRVGGDADDSRHSDFGSRFQSTPPRGRRQVFRQPQGHDCRFQSTPPRGRRPRSTADSLSGVSFNPRLRVGGDDDDKPSSFSGSSFNPRLRVGGDLFETLEGEGFARFNPRLRVGGDLPPLPVLRKAKSFNPRLRVGGDVFHRYVNIVLVVSIHASAWEATPARQTLATGERFQSTPPRGRRPWQASACAHKGFAGAISGICRLALPGFPYFL